MVGKLGESELLYQEIGIYGFLSESHGDHLKKFFILIIIITIVFERCERLGESERALMGLQGPKKNYGICCHFPRPQAGCWLGSGANVHLGCWHCRQKLSLLSHRANPTTFCCPAHERNQHETGRINSRSFPGEVCGQSTGRELGSERICL